jgi:hypothetical protein
MAPSLYLKAKQHNQREVPPAQSNTYQRKATHINAKHHQRKATHINAKQGVTCKAM